MPRTFLLLIVTSFLVGCEMGAPSSPAALGKGSVAPELVAEGWFNGKPPEKADLAGKVVVVDVWAHW